jgi:predicted deacetylase
MMERAMVVSIHDVSPITRVQTEEILRELRAAGIGRCSLLVVPNHHHRGHFLDDAGFCDWLHTRVNQGDEAVIHGYFHERTPRPGENTADRLLTRFYTAGEGEFYDIGEKDALELVGRARSEFASIGLEPAGFIAPAWLLSSAAENALRTLGLGYTTRLGTVSDLRDGRVIKSQSLVWSVRAAWRRLCSLAWNRFLFARLETNSLLRVGIHPPDAGHRRIWRQILALIKSAAGNRQAMTYQDRLASRFGGSPNVLTR